MEPVRFGTSEDIMYLIQDIRNNKFLTVNNRWTRVHTLNVKEGCDLLFFTKGESESNPLGPNHRYIQFPSDVVLPNDE